MVHQTTRSHTMSDSVDPSRTNETTGPSGNVVLAPGVAVAEGVLEFTFTTSRGPGGQNVNKRATCAQLRIELSAIPVPQLVLERLIIAAGRRITVDGQLVMTSDRYRSQSRNKADCLSRLRALIVLAQTIPKKRKPTRPSLGSIKRRLESKRRQSMLKRRRQRPEDD